MSGKRLFAIVVIFVLASVAWLVLAGSVQIRTTSTTDRLGDAVGGLWGSLQSQEAPQFRYSPSGASDRMEIAGSDISAAFKLNQRRKGLLWYATYVVDFKAAYKLKNPTNRPIETTMTFTFPDAAGTYDGFAVKVGGAEVPVEYRDGKALASFAMAPGASATVVTGYKTNGLTSWDYVPSPGGAGVVRDFKLAMNTDFAKIDYPADAVSPTSSTRTDDGWNLLWSYTSVVSGRPIGLVMPVPPNPGPLVARITAFAPVSLLFFFAALILLTATSGIRLHPVHYGFLAAAFFAFDLLLAYLADQIDINLAFAIAAATSIALVVGYLLVVVGRNRALVEIAIS
ncbi:MAG: inner membrane CreD family protein, partial [Actinomycetes bacterium]